MANTNSFSCPICGKNTRHLEVELQEVNAVQGMGKTFRAITEVSGINSIATSFLRIVGKRFWKCCECTSITMRDAAGNCEEIIKHGTPNTPALSSQQENIFISQNILNSYNITINNFYGQFLTENRESDWRIPDVYESRSRLDGGGIYSRKPIYCLTIKWDEAQNNSSERARAAGLINHCVGTGMSNLELQRALKENGTISFDNLTEEAAAKIEMEFNKINEGRRVTIKGR